MTLNLSGSTGISGVDGSSSSPALQGSDSNTGISFPAADTVAINTGGTERSRVDSSGRLLVGTSSTSVNFTTALLQGNAISSTGEAALRLARGSSSPANGDGLGNIVFADSNHGDAAYIFCARDGGTWNTSTSRPTRLVFSTTRDNTASPVQRMRILGGTLTDINIIGSPSSATDTGAIDFRTSSLTRSWVIATDTTNFYIADADFSNFAYLAQNPTSWQFASDARLKENIADLDYGIEAIKQIKAKRFNFIGDSASTIGFIAQELKEVIPEAVSGEELPYSEDDTPQEKAQKSLGIGKETLIPVLVNALQEAIAKIEVLEAKVAALEAA